MGAVATKAWSLLARRREPRVVMFGLDGGGKTTILYRMKLGRHVDTIPTIGFNVESLQVDAECVTLWDLGLRSKARPLIRHYLADPAQRTDGLVVVLDSSRLREEDLGELEELRGFVGYAVDAAREAGGGRLPPVLVFANKMDLPGAAPPSEVLEELLHRDTGLERSDNIYVQPCCALTGEGLEAGLRELICNQCRSACGGEDPLGPRSAGRDPPPPGAAARAAPGERAAEPLPAPEKPGPAEEEPAPAGDEAFLEAFDAGRLRSLGTEELLRLAYLHRVRVPGATPRATFEAAKLSGGVEHATRAFFWVGRLYRAPLASARDSEAFLEARRHLFPLAAEEQEALLLQSYSPEVLADPAAALAPLPADRQDGGQADYDEDSEFLRRVEGRELADAEELASLEALSRLAFAVLRRCPTRREAIQRMDRALRALAEGWTPPPPFSDGRCERPFHETRQYAALQLVHAAVATRPEIRSFLALREACPELSSEEALQRHYSDAALARGAEEFVVPDLQPLPSVISAPEPTWHEELSDEAFLATLEDRALPSWGARCLVRAAYLLLRRGRREGLARLLRVAEDLRAAGGSPSGSSCAHETLAYFTLHMVHFYCAGAAWPLQERPFGSFAELRREALDPGLYRAFYSEALMRSREARIGLVLPDIAPLPDLVARCA